MRSCRALELRRTLAVVWPLCAGKSLFRGFLYSVSNRRTNNRNTSQRAYEQSMWSPCPRIATNPGSNQGKGKPWRKQGEKKMEERLRVGGGGVESDCSNFIFQKTVREANCVFLTRLQDHPFNVTHLSAVRDAQMRLPSVESNFFTK